MRISVKTTGGKVVSVETVNPEDPVSVLKQEIEKLLNIPKSQQKVVFKGKILKDELTVGHYKIQDGHTIHVVRSGRFLNQQQQQQQQQPPPSTAAASANIAASSGGGNLFGGGGLFGNAAASQQAPFPGMMGAAGGGLAGMNPELMQQMLNSPLMDSLLSNPQILETMISANPQIQQILEQRPELRPMLTDPATIRQMLQVARNPNLMNQMMRNQDQALANIESLPGGFNALRGMYNDIQQPLMSGLNANSQTRTVVDDDANRGATPNSRAVPNPWAASSTPSTQSRQQQQPSTQNQRQSAPNNMFGPFGGAFGGAGQQNTGAAHMLQQLQDPQFLARMSNPENLQAIQQIQQGMATLQRNGVLPPGAMSGLGLGGTTPNVGLGGGLGLGGTAPSLGLGGTAPGLGLGGTAPGLGLGGTAPGLGLGLGGARQGAGQASSNTQTASSADNPWASAVATQSPEERFKDQLEQLQTMGFTDQAKNVEALLQTNGNVNSAIDRLIGN